MSRHYNTTPYPFPPQQHILLQIIKSHLRPLDEEIIDPIAEAFRFLGVPYLWGGRTGHGKGYYDKLLQHAKATTPLIALAFECQIFPEIPCESHDIYMDKVVTETDVYAGKGR